MIDLYGREITSLRFSITQRCNLNCPYCHREGEKTEDRIQKSEEMSLERIQKIVAAAVKIGIKSVKLTGGEPLLRPDICDIIGSIAKIKEVSAGDGYVSGIKDISLVTNGTLLERYAKAMKEAGLTRINIGCDSFSSNIISKRAENILPGLLAAKEAGLSPIKLNMVVLKGINHLEIKQMIEFAGNYGVMLQLIELIPSRQNGISALLQNENKYYQDYYFSLEKIEQELEEQAIKVEIRKMQGRKQYYLAKTIVELVRPAHRLFCMNCNKIRVTSDGLIKPCLMRNDNLVEFKDETSFIEAIKMRNMYK
ncbi:MAG: GTP 3',8-cyclase MoaA [Candidatus Stahlbacteria bacterium]|nr:GTP 3',8-cyclase MoaA [Candidatus Stahlbacteria bacterium]